MARKFLFFILFSICWCSLWCLPTRNLPEGVYIVRDERQKSPAGSGGNIHVKVDGFRVAVPVSHQLTNGAFEAISNLVYEGFIQLYERDQNKDETPVEYTPITTTERHVQLVDDEKNPETTTLTGITNTMPT